MKLAALLVLTVLTRAAFGATYSGGSVSQGGTWTVQPGNTANTTPWKVDGSSVTQPVALVITPTTASGTLTVQDSGSSSTTGANSSSIVTGTASNNSTVSIAVTGKESVEFMLSGTWSGTVTFEGSMDSGTTWTPFSAHVRGAAPSVASSTANGMFLANVTGLTNYRVRFTTKNSGSVSVSMNAVVNAGTVYVSNAIKLLGNDQTSQLTIKAASTAAQSTDTSAVVSLNPNSPTPSGSNTVGGIFEVAPTSAASTNSATVVSSTAYEASHVLKNSSGTFYSISCYNSAITPQFILLFNSSSVPSNSTAAFITPLVCAAGQNCLLDLSSVGGVWFSSGISWSNSSTSPTKTIGSSNVFCTGKVL